MNNDSGSALPKISFVVALVLAALIGYLSVRYRIKMDQERADAVISVEVPSSNAPVLAGVMASSSKPNYLPLRARVETNIVRVVTNRPIVATRPVESVSLTVTQPETRTVSGTTRDTRTSGGAFIGDGRTVRNNSSVSGRVLLRGTPPPEIAAAVDATCGALRSTPLTTRHYVVSSDRGLANTFVYIKSGAPVGGPFRAAPMLDQVGCEFQPYMIGVRTSQTFMVKNSDPVFHNVNVIQKNPGGRPMSVAQPRKGMATPFVFPRSEVFVRLRCDVHPWMFAYVGVVDHSWFAVTDQNGEFSLPAGLPQGEYTLAAVHLKAGEIIQQIRVTEAGVEPVTFTFELATDVAKSERPKQ